MNRYVVLSTLILVLILTSIAYATTLNEIKTIASSPESGDVLLVWVPGAFWSPPYTDGKGVIRQECTWPGQLVTRDDGTTLWIEPNFWNIVNATGENYLRFINKTDEIAFYVKLDNVSTQWGGTAWITAEAGIVGRAPPSFTGGTPLPSAGGYPWFALPMPLSEFLNKYNELYVLVDYTLVHRDDTLVRYGLIMWFENKAGNPVAEVYVAFYDRYGGWVGDKTNLGNMTVPMILNNSLVYGVFNVQRALSGGGWAGMEFMLTNYQVKEGRIIINIRPFIEKIVDQMVNFFGVPLENLVWSVMFIGSYAGSQGTSFELGWILHDARILSPEQAPRIVTVTTTQMVTTTKTVSTTTTATETRTQVQTTTETATVTTTEIQTVTDWTTTGVITIVLLIIGIAIGYVIKRPKTTQSKQTKPAEKK